ncbi:aldo/keto reductase [Algicella marina]|uniref:Aldo/keto reductase n=1 Tax=Algicella marina TaxID=2683284 RepID=A0A6P1T042_9RHOB|nr:aldo/keto reductase [Algicella marina]QHQ36294.1 aldo/keto reductase [Algicella marina]
MLRTLSGDKASRFSFGTMQFGGKADEIESAAMYSACREAGINFYDTAYGYTEGLSETILGKLIATERDKIFLATKCAASGSSREKIVAEFSESRSRLAQASVDLLYLHRWDADTPLEETFETLAELVEEGSIRHVGVSNFSAWQTMKANRVASSLGVRISVLQPMYNLVKRQVEVEILPMSMSEGFAVCSYSPLGGGLLTGKYGQSAEGRLVDDKMYNDRYGPKWMHDTAVALGSVAKEIGVSPATLAVAWTARHPGLHGPIISARSAQQLAPSIAAIDFKMDDALYEKISALSPRPAPATDRLEEA